MNPDDVYKLNKKGIRWFPTYSQHYVTRGPDVMWHWWEEDYKSSCGSCTGYPAPDVDKIHKESDTYSAYTVCKRCVRYYRKKNDPSYKPEVIKNSTIVGMCKYCNRAFWGDVSPNHDYLEPMRALCEGSKQKLIPIRYFQYPKKSPITGNIWLMVWDNVSAWTPLRADSLESGDYWMPMPPGPKV